MGRGQRGQSEPTEADDIYAIIGYLGLTPTSEELARITGLTTGVILHVLSGSSTEQSPMRGHIAIVAAVIDRLAEGRMAATGSNTRDTDPRAWVHTPSVETAEGLIAPIEILADADLAISFLRKLSR